MFIDIVVCDRIGFLPGRKVFLPHKDGRNKADSIPDVVSAVSVREKRQRNGRNRAETWQRFIKCGKLHFMHILNMKKHLYEIEFGQTRHNLLLFSGVSRCFF